VLVVQFMGHIAKTSELRTTILSGKIRKKANILYVERILIEQMVYKVFIVQLWKVRTLDQAIDIFS